MHYLATHDVENSVILLTTACEHPIGFQRVQVPPGNRFGRPMRGGKVAETHLGPPLKNLGILIGGCTPSATSTVAGLLLQANLRWAGLSPSVSYPDMKMTPPDMKMTPDSPPST